MLRLSELRFSNPLLSHLRAHLPVVRDQRYLLGLRGLLVIESFLWVFLQTFAPASVKGNDISGPTIQVILRKSLSVIFWNETLLYSFVIVLSARTTCIQLLKDPTNTSIAGAAFRRGIRLWFPTAAALAVVKITFSLIGLEYIDHFKSYTSNSTIDTPYSLPGALAYFNSVSNLFWTTSNFSTQAGSSAFPSSTLWVINVIYSQSYTIYMAMIIIPYTRNKWRVEAFTCFIVTAWWVQSWAWFSITGLLFADMVMNMDFMSEARRGIKIQGFRRFPTWAIAGLLMAAGLLMMYTWAAWKPSYENVELEAHTGLYYTGGLNKQYDIKQPQARVDNYLFILGFFLLLESSRRLQLLLENKLFVYLGRRSLSYFLVQSTIAYTAGIKLVMFLRVERHWQPSSAVATCLAVCVICTVIGAEIFHQLVDRPSHAFAHFSFDWIRR